ncbi:unnamed protein product (macronuclear) [Paramecium tetraurelia]|uniref:Uncharacterized protein n=1 Tax=Paramecium tetraurelia TaxID=5888 RepID=A0CIV6_PARTE|nr:uncharacterized protein GSPATT00007858001 [Paramecium tetraurelia]CAK70723.1 unnamed protein product [Paramecium tetraurelia]|eukprot:XP_001438120.1 hypothetical protein (macronuclear) [Paramecium tetraurelia strain d4-2]
MYDQMKQEELFQKHKFKYQKIIEENISLKQEILHLKEQVEEITQKMSEKINFIKQTEQSLSKQAYDQYEITIQRQLTIIEQLILDKKELQQEQLNLTNEIKTLQQSHSQEIEKLQVLFQQEKQQIAQKEKASRMQWEKNKTQEIRQLTVLGLEPEIQKIIKKYQEEIASLRLQLEK